MTIRGTAGDICAIARSPSIPPPLLRAALADFRDGSTPTHVEERSFPGSGILPVYVNSFWTAKQRAAHRLHEISYRACFKGQLPRFFIDRLTRPGDRVFDPFMGRGTTPLEAALRDRIPCGSDLNPLSVRLLAPRLRPPEPEAVADRLEQIPFNHADAPADDDLLVFYHPETLREIAALRAWLHAREEAGELDAVDGWIRMVATNRLTGHSAGFFSVYTMPPNQAVSLEVQRKINAKRNQEPPRRDVPDLILRKSRQLLRSEDARAEKALRRRGSQAELHTASAEALDALADDSISLVVTSPPFLDVVDYAGDNWLRCWFNHIDPAAVPMWNLRSPEAWQEKMTAAMRELRRVVKPGGWVAFEVGEVRGGRILLEDIAVPAGLAAGLEPEMLLINDQKFTKTSHCWGVDNLRKGTNTNRIILFRNP